MDIVVRLKTVENSDNVRKKTSNVARKVHVQPNMLKSVQKGKGSRCERSLIERQ